MIYDDETTFVDFWRSTVKVSRWNSWLLNYLRFALLSEP